MSDCLFCRIIAGEIPGQPVLEGERYYAFRDINPQAPTHVLVVSKTHTPTLADTFDGAVLVDVLGGVRDVAKALGLADFRTVINNGPGSGQTVFHLHAHLLAGRPLSWPPG